MYVCWAVDRTNSAFAKIAKLYQLHSLRSGWLLGIFEGDRAKCAKAHHLQLS